MPNNRQLANLIWLAVVALAALFNRDLRHSLGSTVRAATSRKVGVVLTVMMLWVVGELLIGLRLSWWDPGMTTGTGFWFVGTGLVLFINISGVAEKEHFFSRTVRAAVKFSVVIAGIMNMFVMDLPAEFVLVPVIFVLLAMSSIAGRNGESEQVKSGISVVFSITALGLVAFESVSIARHWSSEVNGGLVKQFLLPMGLTLGLAPFIYLISVYSEYKLAFQRTESATGRSWGRRWALMLSFGPRAHKLHSFMGTSARAVMETPTFAESRRAIQEAT